MTIKKQTPMHLAGAAGQKATCVKLLELDVSCNRCSFVSLSKLIILVNLWNSFQAMIDPNDDLDQKPIHLSAQNDHTHLVQVRPHSPTWSHPPTWPHSPGSPDSPGPSHPPNHTHPRDLTHPPDHTHLFQLFLENRPSLVSSTTKDGNTLAHLAAKKGSVDVLKAMFAVDKVELLMWLKDQCLTPRLLSLGRETDSTTTHPFTWQPREDI